VVRTRTGSPPRRAKRTNTWRGEVRLDARPRLHEDSVDHGTEQQLELLWGGVRNRQLDATAPLAQVSIGRKDRRLLALGLQRALLHLEISRLDIPTGALKRHR